MNLLVETDITQVLTVSASAQNAPELASLMNQIAAAILIDFPGAAFLGMSIGGGGAGQQFVGSLYVNTQAIVAPAFALAALQITGDQATEPGGLNVAVNRTIATFVNSQTLVAAETRVGGDGGSWIAMLAFDTTTE